MGILTKLNMPRFHLFLLLWTCSNFVEALSDREIDGERYVEPLKHFIEAIIRTWKLLSPTIIIREELAGLCRRHGMIICVTNNANATEVAEQLAVIHQVGRQDGLIFVDSPEHKPLLTETAAIVPSLFTSNSPVFIPKDYFTMIKLRLDSNIIFYVKSTDTEYDFLDIFAVKGGAPILIEFGKWNKDSGIRLFSSMSRWGRRTDLKGAEFVNSLDSWNPHWAELIKDHGGNIVGSRGFFQEKLFYITDKLNLTIRTREYPFPSKLLENGSWTGGKGLFQRKEIDVASFGSGINWKDCIELSIMDCPFATYQDEGTLIVASITGTAPNMWVYVQVFGVLQWIIFFTLLVLMVIGLSVINHFSKEDTVKTFGTKRGGSHEHYQLNSIASSIVLVFLYSIQMGSHTNTKKTAMRTLTLVISLLTFLTFVYYTTEITAKMTSGPPRNPVKNFEDVLYHGYSVIVPNSYYRHLLEEAPPGSAQHQVYKKYMQNTKEEYLDRAEYYKKVATEDKTLLYESSSTALLVKEANPYDLEALDLDDGAVTKTYTTLALHKDSEFLQLFNYYILKGHENGIYKRITKKHYKDLFTKEHFGMREPQPLGANNVMFPFIWLCFSACFSLFMALAEKCVAQKISVSPSSSTDVAEQGRPWAERRIQGSGMVAGPSQPPDNIPNNSDRPGVNLLPHQEIEVRVKENNKGNKIQVIVSHDSDHE